jgi:hypothetical protein
MNVRSFSESYQKRKDDLRPYTSPEDSRLQWLERDFLGYFDTWEREVNSSDRSASEKRKMCLSDETLYGIRMTVLSFVEMTRYLLSQPGNERDCHSLVNASARTLSKTTLGCNVQEADAVTTQP